MATDEIFIADLTTDEKKLLFRGPTPTVASEGAIFVSDGTSGLTSGSLYFRPASNGTSVLITNATGLAFNDLSDVDVTGVTNGNAVVFDSGSSTWVDQTNTVSGTDALAFGNGSTASGTRSMVFGNVAVSRIDDTFNVSGGHLVRNDSGEGQASAHRFWAGAQTIYGTQVIDLTIVGPTNYDIIVPTGATFFPDEIDVVQTTTGTADATIEFGDTASNTTYLAGQLQGIDTAGDRNRFIGLLSTNGPATNTLRVRVSGVASAGAARVFWKGVLIEDE